MNVGKIDQILLDMREGVYDFTVDGECSGCGQCCSNFLPMSDKEVKRIRRYVQENCIHEQKHIIPLAEAAQDWTCPFRDNTNKRCVIYAVRPQICREFRCNNPKNEIVATRDLLGSVNRIVFVREEFFGEEN